MQNKIHSGHEGSVTQEVSTSHDITCKIAVSPLGSDGLGVTTSQQRHGGFADRVIRQLESLGGRAGSADELERRLRLPCKPSTISRDSDEQEIRSAGALAESLDCELKHSPRFGEALKRKLEAREVQSETGNRFQRLRGLKKTIDFARMDELTKKYKERLNMNSTGQSETA